MRLIDADALREIMYHKAFEEDSGLQRWDSGLWIRYKMFEQALEETPTIDAEPVRRGKWVKRGGLWICSECGAQDYYAYVWNSESGEDTMQDLYCPNCGAKMEEQNE